MKATDLTDREIFAAVFGAAYSSRFLSIGAATHAESTAATAVEAVRAGRPKLATVGEWRPTGDTSLRRFYAADGGQASMVIGEKWFVYAEDCGDIVGSGYATSLDEAKALCDAVLAVLEARR
jgi:bifunctional ADP-heptose synthase (sugar kinase/adenylyltransferase)